MFFVYVLRSVGVDWFYTGQTENLKARLKQHNAGKTKSTKGYRPLELVYFEVLNSREEAVTREKYLKSGVGREFLRNDIDIKNAPVVQLDTCLPTGREYRMRNIKEEK